MASFGRVVGKGGARRRGRSFLLVFLIRLLRFLLLVAVALVGEGVPPLPLVALRLLVGPLQFLIVLVFLTSSRVFS